jgi:RNA polymerase sigma-70 factor (ECF subfamily)
MKSNFEATALAELPVLYRVARRMTLNASTAEDLVGQTLLQAATAWKSFDGNYPRSWMIRIMQNIYRNWVSASLNNRMKVARKETASQL